MKKNLQGGFAPLLIIAIVAVLAVGGGAYVVTKNKEVRKAELKTNVEVDANAEVKTDANAKGSLRSLLTIGKDTMCTFTSVHEGVTSSGVVYIASNGDMRGDFKSDTSVAGTINSNMIMKGGTSYVWSGAQGAKMNVSATQETQTTTSSNANQSVDLDVQVDYDCKNWTRDDSKFVVPTNVNFIDLEAMMKGAGALPGGATLPSGVDINSMMNLKNQ